MSHPDIAYTLAASRPWTDAERRRAVRLRLDAVHLGEVAEALGRTVIEVVAELGLGEDARHSAARRALLEAISAGGDVPRDLALRAVAQVAVAEGVTVDELFGRSTGERFVWARHHAYAAVQALHTPSGDRLMTDSVIAFLFGVEPYTVTRGASLHRARSGGG